MSSLKCFETEADTNLVGQTIRAEVIHANFMVQLNISFLTAEHLFPLYAQMFPDSKIAKIFKCSRNKTASILNYAIMPALKSLLLDIMKEQFYALVTDATSDTRLKKMNAVCCQIFDVDTSKRAKFQLYGMCATSGENHSKGSTLFEAIDGTLAKDRLDWDNIVSVCIDNTNVNINNKNSIKSRILEKNASYIIVVCNCHILHLAAGRGGSAYSAVSGFDCQEYQVDLY